MTNLILIDGPPGAGKSTLATQLASVLPGSRLLGEMEPDHPLHPIPVVGLGADFAELSEMDVAELGELLLAKWQAFLDDAGESEQVYIVESYPYQSHLRILWQMNASETMLFDWLARLHGLLERNNPTLVMLRFTGGEERARLVCERRGEAWTAFVINFIARTAYGRANHLTGLEGALAFFEAYNSALVKWSKGWPFQRLEYHAWELTPAEQANDIRRQFIRH